MNPNNTGYVEEWKILISILLIALFALFATFVFIKKVYLFIKNKNNKHEALKFSNVLPIKKEMTHYR